MAKHSDASGIATALRLALPLIAALALYVCDPHYIVSHLSDHLRRAERAILGFTQTKDVVIPNVVLVDIDDKSLDKVGSWPWQRSVHARLISALEAAGARVIAFDIVFQRVTEEDDTLAQALRGTSCRTVVGYFVSTTGCNAKTGERGVRKGGEVSPRFRIVLDANVRSLPSMIRRKADAVEVSNQTVSEAIGYDGFMNLDGRRFEFGRFPVLMEYGGNLYPSFAPAIMAAYLGTNIGVCLSSIGSPSMRVGNMRIPFDGQGDAVLMPNRNEPIRRVSAVDLLDNKLRPQEVSGSIAVVSCTARQMGDTMQGPQGEEVPGGVAHIYGVRALLAGQHADDLSGDPLANVLAILLAGVIAACSFLYMGRKSAVLMSVVGVTWVMLSLVVAVSLRILLPIVSPVLTLLAMAAGVSFRRPRVTAKGQEQSGRSEVGSRCDRQN